MKQIKHIPEECTGENPRFTGHIMLKVPNFDEKWGMLDGLGLEMNDEGHVDMAKMKSFSFIRSYVKAAKPFFAEVSIKENLSGNEYKSYEDLSADSDTHPMLMKASLVVVSGMKLGNV